MTDITWGLESEVFPDTHHELRAAIVGAGHNLIDWDDAWWTHGIPSIIPNTVTFFHGSLGNAAKVHNELNWLPGSFCDARVFQCSKWYSDAKEWLLHPDWRILSAESFVKDPRLVADEVGAGTEVFVRPDSPLKPFSGRVLKVAEISLAKLDYGFYFDDETLPVVVCPVQAVEHEWRFVVVRSKVVTGSGYDALDGNSQFP